MVHLEIQFPDDGFIDVAVLDHATPLADGDDCDSDEVGDEWEWVGEGKAGLLQGKK